MEKSTAERKELESAAADHVYTPYYCEENVFFLCKKLRESESGTSDAEGSDLFVVFISNDKKQIPLWHQKASHRADGIVLWDYHVICIQKRKDANSPHVVWDLDTTLPFPSPLTSYMSEAIRPSFHLFSEYQSYGRLSNMRIVIMNKLRTCQATGFTYKFFRIVHAPVFLRCFASDRRHMKDSAGNWMAQPPSYEPIISQDGTVNNLNEYMEIHASNELRNIGAGLIDSVFTEKLGAVLNGGQLEEFFSQIA